MVERKTELKRRYQRKKKLTYRYAGRDFRLTDVHGHIVKELIA